MPGTDTRTGSRTSNPYIQKLQNLQSRSSQAESPERFLRQNYDPSHLLNISRQAAKDDSWSQQQLANQNRNSELSRQKELAAFNNNLQEQSKQNDFNRMAMNLGSQGGNNTFTFTSKTDNSTQNNFERQRQLNREKFNRDVAMADRDRYNQQLIEQQRQAHEKTQQSAQLAAQERIAMLTGHPGESTWRWF